MQKLRKLIGKLVPDKQTNIFRILINGFDAGLDNLSNLLETFKRDRNILETNNVKALRSLVAENGFEPSLLMPATGRVNLTIDSGFFNEFGNEIYLPPYSQFRCDENGLIYFYDSNVPLKLNLINTIPLTEGIAIKRNINLDLFYNADDTLNTEIIKLYIEHGNISEGSIKLVINGHEYREVKSLINRFTDKVFIVKYSNSVDNPIVVYIANGNNDIEINADVELSYKLSNGINGIVSPQAKFETDGLIDLSGKKLSFDGGSIDISVVSGFEFAGNGTSIDTMKSQVGYNHNIGIIFDTNSYKEFIWKFSNILLSKTVLHDDNKSINDIYISKKLFLRNSDEYIAYIKSDKHKFTTAELKSFSEIIKLNEYCLSTHNLFNTKNIKYAFQIEFNNKEDFIHQKPLADLIYDNFMTFLRNKNHQFNVDLVMNKYMDDNNLRFEYYLFNSEIEKKKIDNKVNYKTPYIIGNDGNLPILYGNFYIANVDYKQEQLFFDINFVYNT